MKRKYIELLLKALNLKDKKYLFVSLPACLIGLESVIRDEAAKYDLNDIYFEYKDDFKAGELLRTLDIENVIKHPYFDKSIYDKYAKLDAAFLFIRSYIPHAMDNISSDFLDRVNKYSLSTQKYFRDLYDAGKLNWCIGCAANEAWAKELDLTEEELWNYIFDICLVNNDDPYGEWLKKLDYMKTITDKMNEYHFKSLHYENGLGTDLDIYLPDNHVWVSGMDENNCICNMPTEEIFTSPLFNKTCGKVVSTKPLIHNNIEIRDFWLEFNNGKVVSYGAKTGLDELKSIIEYDDFSCYLGECALVSYDSPISNTGIVFKETLFDENASCHMALGMGFLECLNDECKTTSEMVDYGVNYSKIHVDFMVGSRDLKVVGLLDDGSEVIIIKDGNIII